MLSQLYCGDIFRLFIKSGLCPCAALCLYFIKINAEFDDRMEIDHRISCFPSILLL